MMLKILFLRNFTIEPIVPHLKKIGTEALTEPFEEISFGSYDTMVQDSLELLNESDSTQKYDLIIVSIILDHFAGGIWSRDWNIEDILAELTRIYSILAERASCKVVLNTFIPPHHISLQPVYSGQLFDRTPAIREINQFIRSYVAKNRRGFVLADWEYMSAKIGLSNTFEPRFRFMNKSPFKVPFLREYAEFICRTLKSLRGIIRKVLVVDGDNTLWGGILGEDGTHGIKLDSYEYPGICYSIFQYELLTLKEKGVLLCLCSKNNERDVWQAFMENPYFVLKESDFVSWRINWTDKVENLKDLSQELNVGLDSFVFIDDNSFECERVRRALPEVAVLQVPANISELPEWISNQGLFDFLNITQEDTQRTEIYRAEKVRIAQQSIYESETDFLGSLNMIADVHRLKDDEIERAAQLTQRTNQFNLTTKRYSETEIMRMLDKEDTVIFALLLKDRFGTLGLTGLSIFNLSALYVNIDSFLMSCRIIGRRIEDYFFLKCLELLPSGWHQKPLYARYRKTEKNQIVSNLWSRFGFQKTHSEGLDTFYQIQYQSLNVTYPQFIKGDTI